jgi:hypothetical protein
VLREGTEDDVRYYITADSLLELWDELVLRRTSRTTMYRVTPSVASGELELAAARLDDEAVRLLALGVDQAVDLLTGGSSP